MIAIHLGWRQPLPGGRYRPVAGPGGQAAVIAAACSTPLVAWLAGEPSFAPPGDRAWIASGVATLTAAVALNRRRLEWRPAGLAAAWIMAGLPGLLGMPLPAAAGALAAVLLAMSSIRGPGRAIPAVLLVLAIPMIDALQFFVGYPMRWIACVLNEQLPGVERCGTLLSDGHSLIGVDPACSGVRTLWGTLFFACLLGLRRRLDGPRCMLLIAAAVLAAVLANSIRVGLVFHQATGTLPLPDTFHLPFGMVLLGLALLAVTLLAGPVSRARLRSFHFLPRALPLSSLAVLALLVGPALRPPARSAALPDLPTVAGMPLDPASLPEVEAWFGEGTRTFRCGEAIVATRPGGRLLRPVAAVLELEGFEVHACPVFEDRVGQLWGRHVARRGDTRWLVLERYLSRDGHLLATDASAAWWRCRLRPGLGPATAVTVLERLPVPGDPPAATPPIATVTPRG